MAKISRRLGRLGVDWRDVKGRRRWKTFRGKNAEAEAKIFLGRKLIESGSAPDPDLDITLAEYAPRWLAVSAVRLRPRSLVIYRGWLDKHILPRLGLLAMRDISAVVLRDFLAWKAEKFSRATVSGMLAVLSSIFSLAAEDGIVRANPARGLWKRLGLARTKAAAVRAMTTDQLRAFLVGVQQSYPKHRLTFSILALTGLRIGEALGLQWGDIDWRGEVLHVERQVPPGGTVSPPKTKKSRRRVDVPPGLKAKLRAAHVDRKAADLRAGRGETLWVLCPWVSETPGPAESYSAWRSIRWAMRETLKKVGLPLHFTPHSLRHTFAALHLARGESPKYVQEQLGHESIQVTVDVYGQWMPTRNPQAARTLEDDILGATGA